MIASLAGTVSYVGLDHLVVDVGGVGLQVRTTPRVAAGQRVGDTARLSTSLVVREDSMTLYGFATADERTVFDMVQTVSGVGPRLALAMLAVHDAASLRLAIVAGDTAALTKVPGIGKKGAERLVLELKDKFAAMPGAAAAAGSSAASGAGGATSWRDQVSQALTGLGWTAKQADGAMDSVEKELGAAAPVSEALRACLKELGR